MDWTEEIRQALLAPFDETQVSYLPRAPKDGKALALPYIDARAVMVRLDAVVGPQNWSFDFDPLSADGKLVRGRLTVLGVTKCDAGEAGPEEEPLKSAVSDSIKRAAVHFGIGRYLYELPAVWAAFDAQKRRFTERPRYDGAALTRALRTCGYTGSTVQAPPVEVRRPEPSQAPLAESRGDARAAAADKPAPSAELGCLKADCKRLYVTLGGNPDDLRAMRDDFSIALGSPVPNPWPTDLATWLRIRNGLETQVKRAGLNSGTLLEAPEVAPAAEMPGHAR